MWLQTNFDITIFGGKEEITMLRSFLRDESGMGTIEVVVIVAILVGLALVFRKGITEFVNSLMGDLFNTPDELK